MENPCKLYFLTGFLGSGKTTLINNLLDFLAQREKKAGVIVNEWGQINIDSSLIKSKSDLEIKELNNGQLFCSCLSGKFIEALESFTAYNLDYLLVETSGLANPMTLNNLLKDIEHLKGDKYDYRGMVCIVDPVNFLQLRESLNAIEEQIIHSQLIIINKIDLVSEDILKGVEKEIQDLNSHAGIIKTSFSQVDEAIFDQDLWQNNIEEKVIKKSPLQFKRTRHYVIECKEPITISNATDFALSILPYAYRIKGFIFASNGHYYLDGVNNTVDIKPLKTQSESTKIVIISRIYEEILPYIKENWHRYCGIDYEIKDN